MRGVGLAVLIAALGCGDDSSSSSPDATVDGFVSSNPPLECPTTNPLTCTEPLPSLAGTWTFAPSTTTSITLTASATQTLVGVTSGADFHLMRLFDGDWTVEANGAWRCSRSGSARTLSSICKAASGELKINGETRAPGFHTAYETLDWFTGVLVP